MVTSVAHIRHLGPGNNLQPGLQELVTSSLRSEGLAVALYGSQARGTARPDSDVDVLQLVDRSPVTYAVGRVNVSAYHPQTLRNMAERGSLFVLHLRLDGIILADPSNELVRILESYVSPRSYDPLLAEVRAAASALWPARDTEKYFAALRRLGIYLLRTAVYASLAARNTPTFDAVEAASRIDDSDVTRALSMRLRYTGGGDLKVLLDGISQLIGPPPSNGFGSVEALAVALSDDYPYASALLAQLLAGDTVGIEYTALTPPPL